MPVTFGAVGDIISVYLLVANLAEALNEARGSKAEYRATICELWLLYRALMQVELLFKTYGAGSIPELEAVCRIGQDAASRSKHIVGAFMTRIRKYQKTFEGGQKPNAMKGMTMKLRWRIKEKHPLEQFHAEIAGINSTLQSMLATANM